MLDGGPEPVDREAGGDDGQGPGGKGAAPVPGGEARVDGKDDQLADPERDERCGEQIAVDALGLMRMTGADTTRATPIAMMTAAVTR
jgi:hypothetical protein